LAPTPSLILLGIVFSIYLYFNGLQKRILQTLTVFLGCLACVYIFVSYRGIPYLVFVAALISILGVVVLTQTRFGRFLFAIGSNSEAAKLSGVPVVKSLWLTYFFMGILAAVAGLMDSARVNGAVPSAGELAELDAIAAVVIGGTSLMGGSGSLFGTFFGVLMMGILNNGMSLVGISEHYQKIFKGLVIILAVYLDHRSKNKT
jgi:ABC-type xylose transport system permease subunit